MRQKVRFEVVVQLKPLHVRQPLHAAEKKKMKRLHVRHDQEEEVTGIISGRRFGQKKNTRDTKKEKKD